MVQFLENILALSFKQDLVYSQQSIVVVPLASERRVISNMICLSVLPSAHNFLGIASLVFSETQHNVRDPYIVVCDSWIFWKKSLSDKNGQKWPKNMVFGLFKEIKSLVLPGIYVKSKFSWLINILRKLHTWEKSSFQVKTKKGSQPMSFQYS